MKSCPSWLVAENLMHAVLVRPKSGTVKIHLTLPDHSNVQPKVDDQWTEAGKKKYFDPCKPAARIGKSEWRIYFCTSSETLKIMLLFSEG
jgi:hypothetical protein